MGAELDAVSTRFVVVDLALRDNWRDGSYIGLVRQVLAPQCNLVAIVWRGPGEESVE